MRKLYNEELNDLYSSPNINQVIKLRRTRWAGHVAHMGGRGEVHTGFWWGNMRERDYLEDPGIDGSVISKRIFRKWDGGNGLDLSSSEQGQVVGTCKCGNESSGSKECWELPD